MDPIDIPNFESDGEMTAWLGIDGLRWAALFERTFFELLARNIEDGMAHKDAVAALLESGPGDWLHGWFCNAIAAGEADGYSRREPKGALRKVTLMRGLQFDAGYDEAHDDDHDGGELIQAAVHLATTYDPNYTGDAVGDWPFVEDAPRFDDPRDGLAMAAALLAAEIDRLDRAEAGRSDQKPMAATLADAFTMADEVGYPVRVYSAKSELPVFTCHSAMDIPNAFRTALVKGGPIVIEAYRP